MLTRQANDGRTACAVRQPSIARGLEKNAAYAKR